MRELVDQLLREQGGVEPSSWPYTQLAYGGAMLLVAVALTTFGAVFAGLVSYVERRIAARMHSRIGPNRVGPAGLLQFAADALKLILKEDLVPADADKTLFKIAPYFVMAGFILTFVVLPFGYGLAPTEMNVGLFYVVSVTAIVVVGVLLSGWASNSKWSLFGGMRAAAQVVSYEIPAGLVILVPVMMSGSLSLQGIIRAQGGLPWDWFMFQTPWAYVGFFVFFTALLAEGNRTPFDLPEAESELVAGYNTEYSGMRFGLFFLAEWGNLWVMSALLTTLFLGGWQVPGVSAETLAQWEVGGAVPVWFRVASVATFVAKVLSLVFVIIWIRWTFPRIRVDQMMALAWKYLVPIALLLVVATALTEWASFELFGEAAKSLAQPFTVRWFLHAGFFAFAGLLPVCAFWVHTFRHIKLAGERVDLSNW